jgi:hypothetical protein
MQEISNWLLSADKAMAAATVIIIQIIKMWIPSDPSALPGEGRFTIGERWKKYLLLGTFLVGAGLSVAFDPHKGQSLQGKLGDGIQTGGLAVVMWEIYSNWIRPIVTKKVI